MFLPLYSLPFFFFIYCLSLRSSTNYENRVGGLKDTTDDLRRYCECILNAMGDGREESDMRERRLNIDSNRYFL